MSTSASKKFNYGCRHPFHIFFVFSTALWMSTSALEFFNCGCRHLFQFFFMHSFERHMFHVWCWWATRSMRMVPRCLPPCHFPITPDTDFVTRNNQLQTPQFWVLLPHHKPSHFTFLLHVLHLHRLLLTHSLFTS